jgi:hypothetical protein
VESETASVSLSPKYSLFLTSAYESTVREPEMVEFPAVFEFPVVSRLIY